MYFVNRFFIESDLNSNSKVGSQFHSVIDHLAIHLFDHNHFYVTGLSVLGSQLLALESQVLTHNASS